MNDDQIRSALRRGGVLDVVTTAHYDPLLDPEGAEALGVRLADEVQGRGANAIVVWSGTTDAVLGFIVARRLGLPVVRFVDDDGLLEIHGAFPPTPRVALVTDAARDEQIVGAKAAVTRQGGELIAVVALVGSETAVSLTPVVSLLRIDPAGSNDE